MVHNDANDNNVVVSEDLEAPCVRAIIDYGDAVHTQIINDLAVTLAYAVMGFPDPLSAATPVIKGYHSLFPSVGRGTGNALCFSGHAPGDQCN